MLNNLMRGWLSLNPNSDREVWSFCEIKSFKSWLSYNWSVPEQRRTR
jgi:hypothetical protein